MKQIQVTFLFLLCLVTVLFSQITWTSRTTGITSGLYDVTYGNGLYVAVGVSGVILTSPDDITWTGRTSGTTRNLNCITYGNNLYIVAGDSGKIFTSSDGIIWTSRTSGTANVLYGVTYGNNVYVAAGGNTILTSPDGITWTSRTSGTTNYHRAVTYCNNLFLALGDGGAMLTSPDGITWTSRTSGTSNILLGATYGNNQYVVVGSGGTIRTSPDCITWTGRTSGIANYLYGVTFGSNCYVAVSNYGTIHTSSDGITWTSRASGTQQILFRTAYGNHQYVVTGNSGIILTSIAVPDTTILISPANVATDVSITPTLTWSTVDGAATYRVQVSTISTFATTIADDSARTTGTKAISGLGYSTTYYWRVNVKNAGGTSAWSTIFSFITVPEPPAPPSLLVPNTAATNVSIAPTLTWGAVSAAHSYRVQVSTNSVFETTIADDSTVTVTSKAITGLSNNTVYFWRVNAKNAGGTSAWSTVFNFYTAVLNTPTLLTPANTAIGIATTPTLTWETIYGAATYRVQVSSASTFATTVVDDSTPTIGTKAVTTNLSNGMTYYWRVNAKNAGGTSGWSLSYSFTTVVAVPASPVLVSPVDSLKVSSSVELAWGTVTGASTYRVQVSSVSTFASTSTDDSTLTVGSKSIVLTYPAMFGEHYWRVNAKNAGGTSAWSTVYRFFYLAIGVTTDAPHYVPTTLGHSGVLEVYMANGSRVIEVPYEATAIKTQLINTAYKSLAKGYYTYRFRSRDANNDIIGKMVK
jgi:hypothetical protein